jgi:hypothetical protein
MDEREETTAEPPQEGLQGNVPLAVWLDDQEAERRALIMRLRQIERNLMAHGRLRAPWTTAAQEAGSPTGRTGR